MGVTRNRIPNESIDLRGPILLLESLAEDPKRIPSFSGVSAAVGFALG